MEATVTITITGVDSQRLQAILSQFGTQRASDEQHLGEEEEMAGQAQRQLFNWGPRKATFFRNHPEIDGLLRQLIDYINREVPEARLQQNLTNISIIMPRGLWVGTNFRTWGIRLYYQRGREITRVEVHSPEEIDGRIVNYLRSLPPYMG